MIMDENIFLSELEAELSRTYGTTAEKAAAYQLHDAIAKTVMAHIKPQWDRSMEEHLNGRRAMYLSMEFLMGRAVYNNILCAGLTDVAEKALQKAGRSLAELEEIEDAALGNGGLGRLAACFLDSAATHDIPLDGYGIRYKYGLFKQLIVDGFQKETADDWTRYGDPWSVRREDEAVEITYFGSEKVRAVPYDMPIIGCGTKNIGNLRLWQAEETEGFDFALFDSGEHAKAFESRSSAESISAVLYPNDNNEAGRILRLKQEYFFSAASVADALRKHKERFGSLDSLADKLTIQLNDTHPVIAIPELIRLLLGEGFDFDKAFETAHKVFNYTNHTIMAEALEKWDSALVEKLLPEVYGVILRINERFYKDMYALGIDKAQIKEMAPVGGGKVRMAFMAIYVSSYVNGVAAIHTEILKNDALKEWYAIYPERFQNKTNGITQRRWLALNNPELSALITKLLGSAEWVRELDRLKGLEKFADDESVIDEFIAVKEAKKHQLAQFIKEKEGVELDPSWIFDIQIKRLHEYKRQLLNALSILYIYFGIKDGSIKDFTPTAFIFGAKSAPGYRRAKAIIKLINEIGRLVNDDPATRDSLKVVFVSNYNVSYAEKLVCAADVSEQISTAGTEASGTGNMKLMLNGAVTLGTYDGANVEIVEEAGEENNYIFGARVEELAEIMPGYDPRELLFKDEKIRRVLDKLIDGELKDGGVPSDQEGSFKELYKALTDGASWHVPDHYYVIGDLDSYIEAKLRLNKDYKDRRAFAKKCWLNIANAGKFSSDRTIIDYAENIWNLGTKG
ncbi:MAG: glycogen/starch/alpha-glucan phosphorylase [Ruminococcus sp.]|nr:glycogen/starch/alpha-glucan phosphorylase [Ruminococcus sp.]